MYHDPYRLGKKSSIAALVFLLLAEIPAADLPGPGAAEVKIKEAFRKELKGDPLRVGILEKAPFGMIRHDTSQTGNDRFYGISVDQMNEIAARFDFSVYVAVRMVSGKVVRLLADGEATWKPLPPRNQFVAQPHRNQDF